MAGKVLRRRRVTAADLVAAVAEFDRELVVDTFEAPSAQATARWQRAKRARGRPKRGKGAKVISVSVERTLLERSDALADRMELTRAELIARGLRAMLAAQDAL
jgi:hypothetical protein